MEELDKVNILKDEIQNFIKDYGYDLEEANELLDEFKEYLEMKDKQDLLTS